MVSLGYGGRYDDQTKELYDGFFKIVKVLKELPYNLQKAASNSVNEFRLVNFLIFENKFSLVLCDSPIGYITRIDRIGPLFIPKEADDTNVKLLPVLKTVYQARLTVGKINEVVRKYIPDVKISSDYGQMILPCFSSKKKKRSHNSSYI